MAIADGQGRPGQAMTSHDNDNGRLMTLPRRSSRRLAVSTVGTSADAGSGQGSRAAGPPKFKGRPAYLALFR
jgi:hypothetical protein